jgi:glutathione S-transferase
MKLFYMPTMNPRKVCAAAKYLGSPLEYVRIDVEHGELKQPHYLALNPNGRAPVLQKDDGTTLWESAAIMAYLAQQAGRSDFWPSDDPERQVEVVRWISWDLCEWMQNTGAFYFEHHIKPMFGMGDPDRAALAEKVEPLHAAARVLDAHLEGKPFLTGDAPTVADFCTGVLLPYQKEIELPLADFRNIQRWRERLLEIEAFRDPWPA